MKRSRYASSAACERLRLIARRSPSASPTVKPARWIATSSTWSWKTTTPSVSRSGSRKSGWSAGGSYAGSSRSFWRRSMYGRTALPWIGPGRPRAQDRLHLRAAFDLEAADGVGTLDLCEDVWIVERHAGKVDLLVVRARD